MEALVRELEELLHRWRDFDDELDDAYEQRCLDAKNLQYHLPHMPPLELDEDSRCPLCTSRRWP